MKFKKVIIPLFLFGFILSLVFAPVAIAKKDKKGQEQKVIIIPKEVKDVFQEGLSTKEARLDIPFTIEKHLYLPARENLHSIFLFKVKNEDLGFAPIEVPAEPQAQEQKEEAQSVFEETPAKLRANAHVFLQFNTLEGDTPGELIKEVYIPVNMEIDGATYIPDEEGLYSTAYPLPPGDYILSMAITSRNLDKIGTQYFSFTLPAPASFVEQLETTPIFFCRNIERMSAPETKAEIHKGFFTYSVLKIEPNMDNTFSPGDTLDILFFIFGTQPDDAGKYSIEINYEVSKGEEKVIRYAPQGYESPIVSQPLPMKKTVIIKTTKGEETTERKEQKDLEAGSYTLSLNIKDNISGKSLEKLIDFEVK
ncbi:MAG: hypothetical protein IBX60_07895 [Candidatus Aminicenantes bacterium]|nr:hypothetical protein [Candidatus Aminicenantes bacterium]